MSNELFFEPKINQYGSHMVMTNVHKNRKTKYINIDTKFRDDYNYSQSANYNITLPERITEVTTMRVVSTEIPMSFYNISASLGNNYFYLTNAHLNDISVKSIYISIPDGFYTNSTLIDAVNKSCANAITGTFTDEQANSYTVNIFNETFQFNSNNEIIPFSSTPYISKKLYNTNTGIDSINIINSYPIIRFNFASLSTDGSIFSYTFNFATNSDGTPDKFNFKKKLGWILGFRNPIYTINNFSGTPTNLIPETFIDVYGSKYLYLAIEEFNNGNQSSFIPPMNNSFLNKNIIARVALNRNGGYNFGSVLPANNFNGLLMSDTRSYTGKIDLMKLNVQLLTDNGSVVNLNGLDFSLCLEVTHE